MQRICLALPDAFISVRTWTAHSTLLAEVLTTDSLEQDHPVRNYEPLLQGSNDVQQILLDRFLDIKQRNEAMLFKNMPPLMLAKLGSTVMDIQVEASFSLISQKFILFSSF